MKKHLLLIIIILLYGCSSTIKKEDLVHLNGYWEIEKVVFPDGSSKDYKINTTIDYIEVDNLKGFRKKLQPKFDGSYITSNDAESFTIFINESVFEIYYKNNLSEWKERITQLSKDHFSVMNEDGIVYNYKKYTPINIENTK